MLYGTAHSSGAPEINPGFSEVRVARSLVLCVCFGDHCLSFCHFFFWPLCCLSFFDIRLLITSLVSSNFSDIGQIEGYQAPVFIQQFPWRLHITITYNLPHLRLSYADVVTVIA
jgi:hypothetical protein